MDCFSAHVQSLCITWENHDKMRPQKPQPQLNYTTVYWDEDCFFSLPLCALKAFLYFWLPRSNHFQLYVNTTAFCKNVVSGTQMISTCGPEFSCLPLMRKTSCRESHYDTEKNIHGLQNPCVIHRHTHTHTCYIKSLLLPWHIFFILVPLMLRATRV